MKRKATRADEHWIRIPPGDFGHRHCEIPKSASDWRPPRFPRPATAPPILLPSAATQPPPAQRKVTSRNRSRIKNLTALPSHRPSCHWWHREASPHQPCRAAASRARLHHSICAANRPAQDHRVGKQPAAPHHDQDAVALPFTTSRSQVMTRQLGAVGRPVSGAPIPQVKHPGALNHHVRIFNGCCAWTDPK